MKLSRIIFSSILFLSKTIFSETDAIELQFDLLETNSHLLSMTRNPQNPQAAFFDKLLVNNEFIRNNLTVENNTTINGNLAVGGSIISGGSNIVTGPAVSTTNAVPRFADTTGSIIKDSSVLVDDAGNITIEGITKNGTTLSWPSLDGAVGSFLETDGAGNLFFGTPAGGGNVSTALPFNANNRLIVTDTVSGAENIKQSNVTLDTSNNITGLNNLTATTINATTFNGSLNGAASLNVLKAGDTMTGNLNLATQNEVRFQDAAGGQYVGINAPSTVSSSYTISLPSTLPTANQVLSANAITPTLLEWTNVGNIAPSVSKKIYVAKNGNDSTGNGSFDLPFLTLAKAVDTANGIASVANPVAILISPGIYIEDNSAGPITITAQGISVVGDAVLSTIIQPNTLSNNLLLCSVSNLQFLNFTLDAGAGGSTASGWVFNTNAPGITRIDSVAAYRFLIGFECNGSDGTPVLLFNYAQPRGNTTGISLSSIKAVIKNSICLGPFAGASPANTGFSVTGATSLVAMLSNSLRLLSTGISTSGGSNVRILGANFESTTNGVVATGSATTNVVGCSFAINNSSSVNASASGAGTYLNINGCNFFCADSLGAVQGIAIQSTNQGTIVAEGCGIDKAVTAIQCGDSDDTSSTSILANATTILNSTTDILQQGSSTLNFQTGSATGTKISINDSTNVQLSYFDPANNNTLQIGSFADVNTKIIGASIGAMENPQIDYLSSLYDTQAIGYINVTGNPATLYSTSADNAHIASITTDRSKTACFRLISDTASPIGSTTALRGWDIGKNPTSAELSFKYENNDIVGQSIIPTFTVVQFDGVNNQLQLPTAGTQIVFGTDTNLYRSSTNTLRTDDNFIAAGTISATSGFSGNLTGNVTGSATSFSGPLIGDVTGTQDATVVSLVSGQTAANVASATVLANAATASNTANAIVRRDSSGNFAANSISANLVGNVTGNVSGSSASFTGPLSGDVLGNQSTTLVNTVGGQSASDVAAATVLTNAATSSNTANAIVRRDGSGNFSAGTITANLTGNVTGNVTGSAASFTGSLAGDVTGLQGSTSVSLVGGQTAVNVASATVAANNATNTNTANTIVLRDSSGNFSAGTITASLTGNVTGNLSGNATTATSATTATNFSGSLVGDVTGTQAATVVSLVGGQTASNVAAATVLANASTSNNTASAIVRRDGSGNFSAGTITANLTGNVTGNVTGNLSGNAATATSATTATTATNFTGSLAGDVTGTQGATVVSTVGLQTAANIAYATNQVLTATSNNVPLTLVLRDALGNFNTTMISLSGAVTDPTDAATKDYVDNAVASGFTVHDPAVVVSTTNITLSGTQTIDGVALVANDRVLLVGQTNPVENGLWLVQVGAWTRPTDFASGNTAGAAYVLILEGTVNAGTSWVCNTPNAIIDTDPISFAQFSLADQTTAANVGGQTGQIFRDKTGNTLNLKTLGAANSFVQITNNTNDILIGTNATSSNTASTIVARDGSGNFSAGTITAALTGAASLNVLKAGDTMTGNLNLATQSELRLQNLANANYVGLRAPTAVGTSYTVDLPSSAPTSNQVLQATSASALQWGDIGGSPSTAKIYYVSLAGSDSNNGSINSPFLTVSHAVTVANGVATLSNPVIIQVGGGVFTENNSGGPISITASGISIVGSSVTGTVIQPSTVSNNLFSITTSNFEFANFTLNGSPSSTAAAISLVSNTAGSGGVRGLIITQFQTGCSLSSSNGAPQIVFDNLKSIGNTTGISISNIRCVLRNSIFLGPVSGSTPSNTGFTATGSLCGAVVTGTVFNLMQTAVSVLGAATVRVIGTNIGVTTNGVVASGASNTAVVGCNFITNNASSINVNASGASTILSVTGSSFRCANAAGTPQGIAAQVTTAATLRLDACSIDAAVTGIVCGTSGDTTTTMLIADGVGMSNCTTDISQVATSSLEFSGGVFSVNKLSIADPTNVSFAGFDINSLPARLSIGNTTNTSQTIYEVLNSTSGLPTLTYEPSYYGNKGTVYKDSNSSPTFNGTQSTTNDASYFVITGDRTKQSSVNIISDSGNIGSGDNMRGWSLNKLGTSASLAMTYTNNDTSGQAERNGVIVMQLNGVDNQVEFPIATNTPLPTSTVAKLVWANDTNLYRSASNTLKTDGNVIVNSLTPNRALATDSNNQLTSSTATDTELGYLSGATSSIQTQLNNRVTRSGDTMTGTLTLPAGSTSSPSLNFTGSTTTGLSAATNNLSLSTNGSERLKISPAGTVSVNGFTSSGVVHNDSSGNLSTSLIVNADIDPSAAIADTKLATISTAGKVSNSATTATSANTASAIVARDGSGNFSANVITASLSGNASTATNATNFTGALVGDVTGTQGATSVSLVGGQTAANVASGAVLANAATNLNTASAIVRRDSSGNFNASTVVASLTGAASLNVLKAGDTMTGNLTLPAGSTSAPSANFTGSTTTGLSATSDNLSFSTAGSERMKVSSGGTVSINGLNSTGVVHTDVAGNLSTSLIVNADVSASAAIADTKLATISTAGKVSNSATTATSANTASAIVARDASGNFSAGTITASLTGAASLNVLKAGDTMTGTLTHPAGSAAAPSIQFTGSTNTGLSAATANTLSFDTNGTERMNISTSAINTVATFITTGFSANQFVQSVVPTNGGTTTATASILLFKHVANIAGHTVNFPASPVDGQMFTIMCGTTNSIGLTNNGNGASIVNPVNSLNPGNNMTNNSNGCSVTYFYNSTANTWYRYSRS